MFGYLNEQDIAFYNDILKAREKTHEIGRGKFTEEESLALKLLRFDWTYRESDSAGVTKAGHEAEEDLIAEIDSSSISDELKTKWLSLFHSSYEKQQAALQEYRWLTCASVTDDDLCRSKVWLALKGVTDEQYASWMTVHAKFQRFSDIITKAGLGERLVMTDDCINFTLLRDRAVELLKTKKDLFFFGIAVPREAQDLLDDIVRNDKATFLEMVEIGAAKVMFPSFQIDSNNPDGVWLVTLQMTGSYKDNFGFFFNPKPTRARREWSPKLQDKPAAVRAAPGKPSLEKFNAFAAKVNDSVVGEWIEGTLQERRDAKNAHISAIPERRVKTPMALSNRPMSVSEAPKPKKVKTAPKPRKQKFTVVREVKS